MTSQTATRNSSRRGESLPARLVRGAVGGLVAGAVFIGVTMWFASTMGDPAQGPLMMISTLALGAEAMNTGAANPALGMTIHVVLSVVFGAAFALLAPRLPTNGAVALAGTIYGGLLYLVNFLILAPLAFPVFQSANQPFEVFAHIVFGTLLSFAFFSNGVRRDERLFTQTA